MNGARAIVCLIVLLGARAAGAADPVATLLQLRSQQLVDAITTGDAALWDRHTDAALIYTTEGGEVLDKKAFVSQIKPLPVGVSGRIRVQEFKLARSGDTAVASYLDDEDEDYHGAKLHCQYRTTETWARKGGEWKMIAGQVLALRTDPPAIQLPAERLKEYCGTYRLGDDIAFEIRCEGGGLVGHRNGRDAQPLRVEAPDVLFTPGEPRIRKVFLRDASGRVTGFADRREAWDIVWARE